MSGKMIAKNIVRGVQDEPLTIMVMGTRGVGKSTFAAAAPDPVFLRTEDRHNHLDAARYPVAESVEDVNECLDDIERGTHDYRTLVVDTLDHLEDIYHARIVGGSKWKSIAEYGGGYGRGADAALDSYWRPFFNRCFQIRKSRRMNLIFLAHTAIANFKDPMAPDYHRYVPKLQPKAGALVQEIVDHVLFARFESFAKVKDGETRARGFGTDARIIHTQWSAAFDAKNSANLPPQLPMSWEAFDEARRASSPLAVKRLRDELAALIPQLPPEMQAHAKANAAKDFDLPTLTKIVDTVRGVILTNQKEAS